MIFCI